MTTTATTLETLEELQRILDRIREDHRNGPGEVVESSTPTINQLSLDDELMEEPGAPGTFGGPSDVEAAEADTKPHTQAKRFVHRGNDWNPLTPRQGTDTLQFTIPSGYAFDRYEIEVMDASFPYELNATSYPRKGATGPASIKVKWKLWGLGVVSYRLVAVCTSGRSPAVRIAVGKKGWFEKALHLADQRKSFKLVLTGPEAADLWKVLKPHVKDTDTEIAVEITIAICATVIAVAGFATIAMVLTQVIEKGCNATVDFSPPSLEGLGSASIVFDVGCRE